MSSRKGAFNRLLYRVRASAQSLSLSLTSVYIYIYIYTPELLLIPRRESSLNCAVTGGRGRQTQWPPRAVSIYIGCFFVPPEGSFCISTGLSACFVGWVVFECGRFFFAV